MIGQLIFNCHHFIFSGWILTLHKLISERLHDNVPWLSYRNFPADDILPHVHIILYCDMYSQVQKSADMQSRFVVDVATFD